MFFNIHAFSLVEEIFQVYSLWVHLRILDISRGKDSCLSTTHSPLVTAFIPSIGKGAWKNNVPFYIPFSSFPMLLFFCSRMGKNNISFVIQKGVRITSVLGY